MRMDFEKTLELVGIMTTVCAAANFASFMRAILYQTEADRMQLLARAERGDKHAQMWLGASYEQGRFGKTDFQEALKWFRKAVAQGDPDAQVSLGQMYEDGERVGGRASCTRMTKGNKKPG
jgi:TPR repeat protein